MDFSLSSSKITGTPGETGWVQVHEFKPADEEKLQKRGIFFAVVATGKGSNGLEGVALGREIVGRLHEEYFGNLQTSAFHALEHAIDKIAKEFSETSGGIEIAAVVYVDGVIYSSAIGGAKVMIYRLGMLAEILDSRNETVSASGYPKDGDILICSTSRFLSVVPMGVLKASIATKDINKVVEQLTPGVHASEVQSKAGVVFIKFEGKTEGEKELVSLPKIESAGGNGELVSESKVAEQPEKIKDAGLTGKLRILSFFKHRGDKKLYIRQHTKNLEEVQSKKTAISVGLIILALLVVSIVFGIRQKKESDRKAEYESVLAEAQHQFDEANEIFSLNPQRAREVFTQSKNNIQGLLANDIKDDRVDELWSQLQNSEGIILGEYNIDPELFIDLTLQSNDLKGTDMSLSDETLFVLDKDAQKAVSVIIDSKNTRLLAGPSLLGGAKYIASYSDRAFILSDDKVFEVGDEKRDLIEKDWEGEALPYAYTGNFYILDKGNSQVYRYAGTGTYFSPKTNWFNESVDVNLSDVVSWTIDGNIWMLTNDGNILRFSLGNQLSFNPKGVSPAFDSPKQIYTNDESNYLYILDPQNSRVVVLTKDGDFKAQYLSDKLKDAVDFGVSEAQKKIIILVPGKLLSIELRHL